MSEFNFENRQINILDLIQNSEEKSCLDCRYYKPELTCNNPHEFAKCAHVQISSPYASINRSYRAQKHTNGLIRCGKEGILFERKVDISDFEHFPPPMYSWSKE